MDSITYKCITSKICLQPFADFWGLCEAYNANVVTNNIRQLLGIDIGVLEPHAGMTLYTNILLTITKPQQELSLWLNQNP